MPLLSVQQLRISLHNKPLVQNIDFAIEAGEWLTLVGESGSGKSLTALALGGLLPKGMSVAGRIMLQHENLIALSNKDWRKWRGAQVAYIFQDYQSSFTPFITIGKQLDEMIRSHRSLSKSERRKLAFQALEDVQLPPDRVYHRYPFQLSGGQLQRAAIAAAIMLRPSLLIADEPTTALDCVNAAHVLETIARLQKKTNCAILFITHDLRQAKTYSDTIAVMKQGQIVEMGRAEDVLNRPSHPYTKQLLQAIPPVRQRRLS
ncbi:ABC transporter ATP-binding protein [Geobacillus sp. BMUD]|uniref:ABC transporter ATP-binding protein n=1 Tax=Geobacillus sp. BMUD TaxID=2508876 RepID=UPI0014929864|nr:ABC transporter ATP-binding protein [Geobacillus sp. BMUD]NNU82517.1 ABC transporter ATP-binding protein [Geobacillus sp. BMUD]